MKRSFLTVVIVTLLTGPVTDAADLTAGFSEQQLKSVREAADRGLQWLAQQQNDDGSFSSIEGPDAEVTSYATLSFLARGHQPGRGRYGRQLGRAIDFLLATQRNDGAFTTRPSPRLPQGHALTGLTLSEAMGGMSGPQFDRVSRAIPRALGYSRRIQQTPKLHPEYRGGWFYRDNDKGAKSHWSHVVPTSWELAFLRSANNAGFEVPQAWVNEGLQFVGRCYRPGPSVEGDRRLPVAPGQAVFRCWPRAPAGQVWANFGTTSAGMLSLQLHGRRDDSRVLAAADWLGAHPVPRQGTIPTFFYSCYMTSHAMSQVGGDRWERYFPKVAHRLSEHQDDRGYWRLDDSLPWGGERNRGAAYNTALAVLCLSLPDQLLPIHQR